MTKMKRNKSPTTATPPTIGALVHTSRSLFSSGVRLSIGLSLLIPEVSTYRSSSEEEGEKMSVREEEEEEEEERRGGGKKREKREKKEKRSEREETLPPMLFFSS